MNHNKNGNNNRNNGRNINKRDRQGNTMSNQGTGERIRMDDHENYNERGDNNVDFRSDRA
jgi:hypothetical protein